MDGKRVNQALADELVITPVAVEKLASEKSAKIKTRQEAPQTIFSSRLDIFHLPISAYFEKKGLFQQPRDLSPAIPRRGVSVRRISESYCVTQLKA